MVKCAAEELLVSVAEGAGISSKAARKQWVTRGGVEQGEGCVGIGQEGARRKQD